MTNDQEVWPIGVETLEWLATLPAHLVVDGGALLAVNTGIAATDVRTLSARTHATCSEDRTTDHGGARTTRTGPPSSTGTGST